MFKNNVSFVKHLLQTCDGRFWTRINTEREVFGYWINHKNLINNVIYKLLIQVITKVVISDTSVKLLYFINYV